MYGTVSKNLMKQIVVMEFCVWYNLVIFLYEYMAARRAVAAPALNGSAKISPASPVDAQAWKGAHSVAPERSTQDVAVNINITEMTTAALTARDGLSGVTTASVTKEVGTGGDGPVEAEVASAPAPSVRYVVFLAGKKLLKIPNTYASILGIMWALISFKYGIKMPNIINNSLFTIHTTAVGLSMFSSGTFIARQSRFIPCGYKIASLSIVLKFLIGPVVMLLALLVIGLHGTLLHIAVVQAALPLAVTSFLYAEEYKIHADIISTGVILGMFISLPVTIVYYILLGL